MLIPPPIHLILFALNPLLPTHFSSPIPISFPLPAPGAALPPPWPYRRPTPSRLRPSLALPPSFPLPAAPLPSHRMAPKGGFGPEAKGAEGTSRPEPSRRGGPRPEVGGGRTREGYDGSHAGGWRCSGAGGGRGPRELLPKGEHQGEAMQGESENWPEAPRSHEQEPQERER